MVVSAQSAPPTADKTWRDANDAVGQYKRGHADILKWEKDNPPVAQSEPQDVASLSLLSADAAVRQAWLAHRELVKPMAKLGTANVDLIAQGRWLALDPMLQRRVDDVDELLEIAAQARKAWYQAVAARQVLKQQRDALDAAEAGTELGRRMVSVGNWSKLQQAQVQLSQASAQMNVRRAHYVAAQAQSGLIKALQLTGVHASVALPERLPDLPLQAMAPGVLDQRAAAIAAQLPRAEALRNGANARLARQAYLTSHALALSARDEVLKVREFITEETVLHYNGMLKSVWDLLGEAASQSQAVAGAIDAQRDFWLAETDLQWVLQGGAPDSFVSLGGGGGEPAAAAGH
jgi:outer membrane protein TolC